MKVNVDGQIFTLVESGKERWEVFGDGPGPLGEVWKGHRTFSPPTHRGSRIVRFHKQVQCWKASGTSHRRSFDTRKDAIRHLLGAKD